MKKELYKNVEVFSYKGENEYAVKLYTKGNDEVILYRTDRTGSLENLYSWVYRTKERANYYNENDTLTIPNINVDKLISYNELCVKKIENSLSQGIVIDWNEIKTALSAFNQGWIAFMTLQNMPATEIEEVSNIYEKFIEGIN